jgi:hypothetical protein
MEKELLLKHFSVGAGLCTTRNAANVALQRENNLEIYIN